MITHTYVQKTIHFHKYTPDIIKFESHIQSNARGYIRYTNTNAYAIYIGSEVPQNTVFITAISAVCTVIVVHNNLTWSISQCVLCT